MASPAEEYVASYYRRKTELMNRFRDELSIWSKNTNLKLDDLNITEDELKSMLSGISLRDVL